MKASRIGPREGADLAQNTIDHLDTPGPGGALSPLPSRFQGQSRGGGQGGEAP